MTIFTQEDRNEMAEAVLDIGLAVARQEVREARRELESFTYDTPEYLLSLDGVAKAIGHYARLRAIRSLLDR